MILRGEDTDDVHKFKVEAAARGRLLDWLGTKGLTSITRPESISDHYVAACAAALGAWQWALGKPIWCFSADLPHHPYDFAC